MKPFIIKLILPTRNRLFFVEKAIDDQDAKTQVRDLVKDDAEMQDLDHDFSVLDLKPTKKRIQEISLAFFTV